MNKFLQGKTEKEAGKARLLNEMLQAVCDITETTPEQLMGRSRKREMSDARHLFFYVTRFQTDYDFTLDELGRFLYRDHTTVISSQAKAQCLLRYHKPFQRLFKKLVIQFNIITPYMTLQEKQAALELIDVQIDNLREWLKKNHTNVYRSKVSQDLREAESERKKLLELELKAA